MKLAISSLLFLPILVAGMQGFISEIVVIPPLSNSNLVQSCKKQVIKVEFQSLKSKSGATYVRTPTSKTVMDLIESSWVKLGTDADVRACLEAAAGAGYNSFMVREGDCLASGVAVPAACAGAAYEDVIYSVAGLATPDSVFPASAISNLKVEMAVDDPKFKLSVSFDEGSPYSDLYTYKLSFDDRTEEVISGSEIITELSSCFDLVFTLTPYFQGMEWGPSAIYELPAAGVPPPQVDPNAVGRTIEPAYMALDWTNFLTADPCGSALGYNILLSKSVRGDADQTLEFSANETGYNLTCKEGGDFRLLQLSVRLVAGAESLESYEAEPHTFYDGKRFKYFDQLLQACLFKYSPIGEDDAGRWCESNGGQIIGLPQIRRVEQTFFESYLPLRWNESAQVWHQDDGTILASTDPLWVPGFGRPPKTGELPYFSFGTGKVVLAELPVGTVTCFL